MMSDQEEELEMIMDNNVKKLGQYFPPELSLFEEPPLLGAISSEEFVDYRPSSASLNAGSLDYIIPVSGTQMVDLKSSRHHVKFKIVHASDGSDVNPLDEPMIGPINYIGCSMWDTIQLHINQTMVTQSGGQNIPYRSIIEALLDTGRFKKDTEMQAGLYMKDTAPFMGPDSNPNVGNLGFQQRAGYTAGSRTCTVVAPITVDLAQQGRLILNGVELGFRFFPGRPEFHLMLAPDEPEEDGKKADKGGYRIEILEAFLRIKKKTLEPSVLLGMESTLRQTPALYPVMRTEVRKFLIHRDQHSFTIDDVYQQKIPSVLVLCLVNERASSGDITKNPFNFIHCGLSDLSVTIDDKNAGQPPMKMLFHGTNHLMSSYLDGFQSLYQQREGGGGEEDSSTYCDIDRQDWATGYTLFKYVFNSSNTTFLPVITKGNLRITGNFSEPLKENTTLIAYARFASIITIDKSRRVTY